MRLKFLQFTQSEHSLPISYIYVHFTRESNCVFKDSILIELFSKYTLLIFKMLNLEPQSSIVYGQNI